MTEFQQHYKGRFVSTLQWQQLDELWQIVLQQQADWYIYLVGEVVPTTTVSMDELQQFIKEVDTLLHHEHDYDYCGIVYADDAAKPTMIKIHDPNNLGASCGSSGQIIYPRWILSQLLPQCLEDSSVLPANRKRWWQRLFPT